MARIILGSYMVRYPLGGNLSWALQYLTGFRDLGHEIFFVEKYAYADSCWDPQKKQMGNDCAYGVAAVSALLSAHGLASNWCFVAYGDVYHGLNRNQIEEIFRTADLYIEMGAHEAWAEESAVVPHRVFIDVDPAYTQYKMANALKKGQAVPQYHQYFTIGTNIGKEGNKVPRLDIAWKHLYNPVNTKLFPVLPVRANGAYTTIMNWKSYEPVEYDGITYGQKDIEFLKFMALPMQVDCAMEVAISGPDIPFDSLHANRWATKNAHDVTVSFDSFRAFIQSSRGEFSVCKHVYIANDTGWVSDKSAAYLASGRPVVVQDTGFSRHIPVGAGLFGVNDIDEAREAIQAIEGNYEWHSKMARQIALDYFDTSIVLKKFLSEVGI